MDNAGCGPFLASTQVAPSRDARMQPLSTSGLERMQALLLQAQRWHKTAHIQLENFVSNRRSRSPFLSLVLPLACAIRCARHGARALRPASQTRRGGDANRHLVGTFTCGL